MSRSSSDYISLQEMLDPRGSEYYLELKRIVGINANYPYNLLAKFLFATPFTYFIKNDENRAVDGQLLRQSYLDENNYYLDDIYDYKCTMFELLIALSIRLEFITDDSVNAWFMQLLKNTGLDVFTDDHYYTRGGDAAIRKIVLKIIDRGYRRNGYGGLFPLIYPTKDQRNEEIWAQMTAYLNENHSF